MWCAQMPIAATFAVDVWLGAEIAVTASRVSCVASAVPVLPLVLYYYSENTFYSIKRTHSIRVPPMWRERFLVRPLSIGFRVYGVGCRV